MMSERHERGPRNETEALQMQFKDILRRNPENGQKILLNAAERTALRIQTACKERLDDGNLNFALIKALLNAGFELDGDHSAKCAYGAMFSLIPLRAPEGEMLYEAIRAAEFILEDEANRIRDAKRTANPNFIGDIDLLQE